MDKDIAIEALESLVRSLKGKLEQEQATNECLFNESVTYSQIGYSLDSNKFIDLVNKATSIDEKQKLDIQQFLEES